MGQWLEKISRSPPRKHSTSSNKQHGYICHQLPSEVWEVIISFLDTSDVKRVCSVSKVFLDMARNWLWHAPTLKARTYLDVRDLINRQLPIKHLKWTQIKDASKGEQRVRKLVDVLLNKLSLSSFDLNGVQSIGPEMLTHLLRLPIQTINTEALLKSISVIKLVDILQQANKRPGVIIDSNYHADMTADDWKLAADKLNVKEIDAWFPVIKPNFDWESYSDSLASISPPPKYTLRTTPPFISPEKLQTLSAGVRITNIYLDALRPPFNLIEYITILQECRQRPVFTLGGWRSVTTMDLKLLFQFPIGCLRTNMICYVDPAEKDEIADMIVGKHCEGEFGKLYIDSSTYFTDQQVDRFREVGLRFVMQTSKGTVVNPQ